MVPIVARWRWIWLASMRMHVCSLVLLSGLRIWCCCELWCRSQTQLGILHCCGCGVGQQLQFWLDPQLGNLLMLWVCGPKRMPKKKKSREHTLGCSLVRNARFSVLHTRLYCEILLPFFVYLFVFTFTFFFFATPWHMELLGQGSDPSQAVN